MAAEAAEVAEPGVEVEDTELAGAARLPDVHVGRGGDGAAAKGVEAAEDGWAAEHAEPGVAAQETKLSVSARLPDIQA